MSDSSVAMSSAEAPADETITVVAVHGNGGGAHRFSLVGPLMPPDVRLHAVTLPGFAAHQRDPSLQTMHDYARHLALLVEESPRPRVLLGHGIGGSLALQLAQVALPELDGLILHAPVGAHLDTRWFPWLMGWPGVRDLGRKLFASRELRPFFRWLLFTGAVPRSYSDQFFDEYATCSVFGQMFDLITAEWFSSLQPVAMPTAILWGAADRVLTVDQLSEFRKLLPDALLARIVGWGHFPMAEAPRSYADEVAVLARALVAVSKKRAADTDSGAVKAQVSADAQAAAVAQAEAARHDAAISTRSKPT